MISAERRRALAAKAESHAARKAAWLANPPVFHGHLVAKGQDRSGTWFLKIVWVCRHDHPTRAEARDCQKEERARRRAQAKAAESKNRRRRPYAPPKSEAAPRPQLVAKAKRPVGGWVTDPIRTRRHGIRGEISLRRRVAGKIY